MNINIRMFVFLFGCSVFLSLHLCIPKEIKYMIRERPKFLDKRVSLIEHRKPKGWARTQRIMFAMDRQERTDNKHSDKLDVKIQKTQARKDERKAYRKAKRGY